MLRKRLNLDMLSHSLSSDNSARLRWDESTSASWSGCCPSGYTNKNQLILFLYSYFVLHWAWTFFCFFHISHCSFGDPSWDKQGQFGDGSWVTLCTEGGVGHSSLPSVALERRKFKQVGCFFSQPPVKTVARSCISQRTWKPCSLLKDHIFYFNNPFHSSSVLRLVKFTPARLGVKFSSLNYAFLTLSQPFFSPYHPPLFKEGSKQPSNLIPGTDDECCWSLKLYMD